MGQQLSEREDNVGVGKLWGDHGSPNPILCVMVLLCASVCFASFPNVNLFSPVFCFLQLLKPSRGDNGVAAFLSGEPGASGLAVEVTALRESVEKELDPHVLVQKGDARGMKRKKETEKKGQPKKQKENLLRKGGTKKESVEESIGNVMEDIKEEDGADGDRNCGVRQGKAKQGSSSTRGRADEREKQKGKGEKRKKVKVEEEEEQGRKKIKKEKKVDEKQELESLGEELGVGNEGEESEDGKGLKEEEMDEKGWGQIKSIETEEKEVENGDMLGKKQKDKEKKPKERKKKKGKKNKEKSEEEETPKKTQKRKSKDEGEENNNKKVKKERKEKEKKEETENKWKW